MSKFGSEVGQLYHVSTFKFQFMGEETRNTECSVARSRGGPKSAIRSRGGRTDDHSTKPPWEHLGIVHTNKYAIEENNIFRNCVN